MNRIDYEAVLQGRMGGKETKLRSIGTLDLPDPIFLRSGSWIVMRMLHHYVSGLPWTYLAVTSMTYFNAV